MTLLQLVQAQLTFWICLIASHAYLFIYLFIYLRICTRCTGAKTIGHKSPTRFKHQPNPTQPSPKTLS